MRSHLHAKSVCPGFFLILLAGMCSFATYSAPKSGLSFYGSMYTDMGLYHDYQSNTEDEFDFRGITTLGLNFQNTNRRYGKVEGSIDLFMPHGKYAGGNVNAADSTVPGLDTLMLFQKRAPLLFDIRKLYLSVYLPFADVTLGRQIINFGKGYLFSPIDVFSVVEVTDLNLRRRGSDIVMARIPIGILSGIDIVVQMPFLDQSYSSALKFFTTLEGWDLSAIGIYRNADELRGLHDEMILGTAFKGDLEVGVHGEAVVLLDNKARNPEFEGMLGVDYSIGNRFLLMAEYLYKQNDRVGSLWGEHNAFGSVQYTINDIMNVSGNVIHDFQNKLTIGTVQYFYNVLQNVNTVAYIRGYSGVPFLDTEYAIRVEVKF